MTDVPGTGLASAEPLLRTERLSRYFKIGNALSRRVLHAVDDVGLSIGERQIVALAGESGSGKSTIARLLARIYKPTSGEIYFQGRPLSALRSRPDLLRYSGLVPMVFQDPFSSLNPVFPVSHGVLRGLKLHRPELSREQRYTEALRVFDRGFFLVDQLGQLGDRGPPRAPRRDRLGRHRLEQRACFEHVGE